MGILDYFIRNSLLRSSIYIATSLIVLFLFNLESDKFQEIFNGSFREFIFSNSLSYNFNLIGRTFMEPLGNIYVFSIFFIGLLLINLNTFIKIIVFKKEINMPYALNFFNPIKKYEWQDRNTKTSHDKFFKSTINSIVYKNRISIDLVKYENSKNAIIQYLTLPNDFELNIVPFKDKGVELQFFKLPFFIEFENKRYKKGSINLGLSSQGIHYIDILKLTHLICVGESGSGKSTLLNILSSLLKPKHGEVLYDNSDLYAIKNSKLLNIRRKDFGIIFQAHYLFRGFSANENLEIASLLSNEKVDDNLLESLKIKHVMKQGVGELSGGQQQRLSIARILTKNPKIIFADEPTGNLDKQTANEVMNTLFDYIKNNNAGLILVTHEDEIAYECDKVYKLVDLKLEELK